MYNPDPYGSAGPALAPGNGSSPLASVAGARVEGTLLVVPNGAPLPRVCLKCGDPEPREQRRHGFSYTPPWAYFFAGLVMLLLMKRSTFVLPLCTACNARWRRWNLRVGFSWLPGAGLIGLAIGLTSGGFEDVAGFVALVGFLLLLVLLVTSLVLRTKHVLSAARIDKTHTWIRGLPAEALRFFGVGAQMPAAPHTDGPPGYRLPPEYAPWPGEGAHKP